MPLGGLGICCCEQTAICDYCTGGAPPCLDVTLAGFADGDCSHCADYNRTYRLAYGSDGSCEWSVGIRHDGCCDIGLGAALVLESGHYILRLTISGGPGGTWEYDFGATQPDCAAWSELALTQTVSGNAACDDSGASVTVSAGSGDCTTDDVIYDCWCGDDPPATWTVVISGFTAKTSGVNPCDCAAALDGTYVLTPWEDECSWQYVIEGPCGYASAVVRLALSRSANRLLHYVTISLIFPGGLPPTATWIYLVPCGENPTCAELVNVLASRSGSLSLCGTTPATVTFSAD